MESLPVTIRLLDPPLHEFLPQREDLLVEISHLEDTKPRSPKLKELRPLLARVQELHETNPMLGLRGCRLGIAFPEITEMQVPRHLRGRGRRQEQGRRSAPRNHGPAHRLH
jgi:pyruvate,orthophosphate dikinase